MHTYQTLKSVLTPLLNGYSPQGRRPRSLPAICSAERVAEQDGIRLGNARMFKHRGVYVLKATGDWYELGYAHGRLLAPQVRAGAVNMYASLDRLIFNTTPARPLVGVLGWFLRKVVVPRLLEHASEDFVAEATGVADGAGMEPEIVLGAYLMPEAFLYVLGHLQRMVLTPQAPAIPSPGTLGCTNVVVSQDATTTGELFMARNLDYQGTGYADRFPLISFLTPRRGYRLVTANSAGFSMSGLTAMNEKGLVLASHQNFINRFNHSGVPVPCAANEAITQAATLDEAVDILDAAPSIGGFSYIIAHGPSRRALVYQVANGKRAISPLKEGLLCYTNSFMEPELQELEVDVFPAARRSSHGRCMRAQDMARASYGEHTPATLATLLGDNYDYYGKRRTLFGNTIANAMTVLSAIFQPETLTVYISNGLAPASRREFIPFSLQDEQPVDMPAIKGRFTDEQTFGRAFEWYRQAYSRCLEHNDYGRAALLIANAIEEYPDDPYLHAAAGLLEAKNQRLESAISHLRIASEQEQHAPRKATLMLHLARLLDINHQRNEARRIYSTILNLAQQESEIDPGVVKAARTGRWRRCRLGWLRKIGVDLAYADVIT